MPQHSNARSTKPTCCYCGKRRGAKYRITGISGSARTDAVARNVKNWLLVGNFLCEQSLQCCRAMEPLWGLRVLVDGEAA